MDAAAPNGGPRWSDRWFNLRNRLLASPRFQRFAAAFPPTRWLARARAASLFDLCAGFVYAQVLHACVRLRVMEALATGPRTVEELTQALDLPASGVARLMDAAVSLRLAQARGPGRYGLGVHGAALLGNPQVAALVEHHALFYRDLMDPVALLRGTAGETQLGRFWSYTRPDATNPETVGGYSTLMAQSQSLISADILEAYPLGQHRRLLDVGGGEGDFLRAVAAHAPGLELTLFDLPAVAARAQARLAAAAMQSRVTVVGGDVFVDPLPTQADVVSLVRVIHDHDDDQALAILRAVHRALPRGGRIMVAEPLSDTAGAEPMGAAYFGFYLLAMGQGRPRTAREHKALLHRAGFVQVVERPTRRPMLTGLLLARAA